MSLCLLPYSFVTWISTNSKVTSYESILLLCIPLSLLVAILELSQIIKRYHNLQL